MEGDGPLLKVLIQREVRRDEEALLKVLPWRVKMITVLQWVHILCHIVKSNKNANKEACLLQAKIQNY